MKGSSHAWAGSALSMRKKLPLAAKGQSSSASSKAHAFGLHGARWIAFKVLTRKRHCSTPSAACQAGASWLCQKAKCHCSAVVAGCRCAIHIMHAARHCRRLDQERRWMGKLDQWEAQGILHGVEHSVCMLAAGVLLYCPRAASTPRLRQAAAGSAPPGHRRWGPTCQQHSKGQHAWLATGTDEQTGSDAIDNALHSPAFFTPCAAALPLQ